MESTGRANRGAGSYKMAQERTSDTGLSQTRVILRRGITNSLFLRRNGVDNLDRCARGGGMILRRVNGFRGVWRRCYGPRRHPGQILGGLSLAEVAVYQLHVSSPRSLLNQ